MQKDRLEHLGGGDDDGEGAGARTTPIAPRRLSYSFKSCPHDLSPRRAPGRVNFLGRSLARLAGEEGRLPAALASALNARLVRGGPTRPTTTLALCRDVEPFVAARRPELARGPALAPARGNPGKDDADTRVSDAATLSIALALGGLRACPGAIDRVASSVEMAIAAFRGRNAVVHRRREPSRGIPRRPGLARGRADFALTHSHAAACAPAADLFVEQCVNPGVDGGRAPRGAFPADADPDPDPDPDPHPDADPSVGKRRPPG